MYGIFEYCDDCDDSEDCFELMSEELKNDNDFLRKLLKLENVRKSNIGYYICDMLGMPSDEYEDDYQQEQDKFEEHKEQEKNIEDNKKEQILEQINQELKSFISKTNNNIKRPRIIMKDGVNMSLQASAFHFCKPQISALNDYEEFEIGYPSKIIEQLKDYAEYQVEDEKEYLNSVYPLVPKDVIIDILYEHGGIDFDKIFNKKENLNKLKEEKTELEEKNRKAQELINEFMIRMGNILGDQNG